MNVVSHNSRRSARQTQSLTSPIGHVPEPGDDEVREMSSAGQAREERDQGNLRSSRASCDECADLMHELANTATAVLMNIQVLGWKLPPYSRLKRPLREIERNAQRGGELVKRLLSRVNPDEAGPENEKSCVHVPRLGLTNTVMAQEPGVDSGSAVNLPPRMNSHPAPVFSQIEKANSQHDVMVALARFPKRDDGNEY